jgi:hypothetical protein
MTRPSSKSVRVPYGGAFSTEDLPSPIVHYPWAGPWIEFQSQGETQPAFCSCFTKALRKYLILHREALARHEHWYSYRDHTVKSLFNPNTLSPALFERYMQLDDTNRLDPDKVMDVFIFSDRLCHLCNNRVPSYRYCVPMYGGVFRQTYGWYIEKRAWQLGLRKAYFDQSYLEQIDEGLPSDILEDIVEMADAENDKDQSKEVKLKLTDDSDRLRKTAGSARSRVERWIENFVRDTTGYPRVGEGWPSETLLYKIICNLYPSEHIEMHAKPRFLEGLEIDVFLPERKLAVEYQGIQHYKPIEHWGGDKALKNLQERDARKRKLCDANGFILVYFDYDEDIDEEIVRKRLLL